MYIKCYYLLVMFRKQHKGGHVIEFEISFNLTAIGDWIKAGANIEQLGQKAPNWYRSDDGDTLYPELNSYRIDVVPYAEGFDAYYHRRANQLSNNISGTDYLRNADDEIVRYCERHGIKSFRWETWNQYITATVNEEFFVMMAPIHKFIELQTNGKLSNESFVGTRIDNEQVKVDVPLALNDDGTAKKTMPVWHSTASPKSIGYMNELVSISGHTLNFEVEY